MKDSRRYILQVGAEAGGLCGLAVADVLFGSEESAKREELIGRTEGVIRNVWCVSRSLNVHLEECVRKKLQLNARKYPVGRVKGSQEKYTAYSDETGVTKTNQSILSEEEDDHLDYDDQRVTRTVQPLEDFASRLPLLSNDIQEFAAERQWTKDDTPRNLVMALMGEVGELCEILQFKGESHIVTREEVEKLSQEVADVIIYTTRLVRICNIMEDVCTALSDR